MKILESSRLILRPWKSSDLGDLHEITSNNKVSELAGFNVKTNIEESLKILNKFIIDSSSSLWAIELKNYNKVIGWIELHKSVDFDYKGSKEIGFVLSENYWGNGLAKEAIEQVINYAFNEEKVTSIICSHFTENIQSKRVINKCGFIYKLKKNNKEYYCLSK